MDCQLEIRWGRKILGQGVCYKPYCCACCIACNFRSDSLDSALWPLDTRPDIDSIQASSAHSAAIDIPQDHAVLHHDIHPDLYGYRHAVRTVSSLSILCLYRLVDTVPAMESWLASNLDIRGLGGSRMGVERVSEY